MDSKVYTIKTALGDYFQGALGETKLRELLKTGQIRHKRVGNKILIKKNWLDEFMDRQVVNEHLETIG